MKKLLSVAAFAVVSSSLAAHADPFQFRGSDTLFGAITDAINQAGLQDSLQYLGGGSGLGEAGLRAGTQAIAPMSRALTDAAISDLQDQGVTATQAVIGLDGVSVYVKASESPTQIDIPTLRGIFNCSVIDWSAVPGAGKSGPISAFRRNDSSGTTDTFKNLVMVHDGVTDAFGSCVQILETTQAIADQTSTDASAVAFAGLSGERPGANKPLAVSRAADGPFIAPAQGSIRDFSYPLARRLYLQILSGGRAPSEAEQALADRVLDRSFFDPILITNEFVTCLSDDDGGCP
jgi:ABC-type phosphate transport system substrate-binding protein